MPQTDAADLYMFRSYESGRSNYVTFIANYNPRHPPFGGPNFYALDNKFYYNIYIDNNGDGHPDFYYQFSFISELINGVFGGIKINVNNIPVDFSLKAAGPITSKNDPDLAFLEYYHVNYVEVHSGGGQTTTAITQAGSKSAVFQKPFDYVGNKTFPNYVSYANQFIYNINIPKCSTTGKLFVGQRNEPFSINLGKIFDLINFIPIQAGTIAGIPGIAQSVSNNVIRGNNIDSLIIEVPIKCLIGSGNGVIGAWTSTVSQANHAGKPHQKSRLGNPLYNELITGLKDKDRYNRRNPIQDGKLMRYAFYPTFPQIINALFFPALSSLNASWFTLAPTNKPRHDLVAVFLTGIPGLNQLSSPNPVMVEYMRLNTSTPVVSLAKQNPLGVIAGDSAGYPNGRRPGDDIVDITLRVAMGVLCHIPGAPFGCTPDQAVVGTVQFTDGSPLSASDFQSVFPYLNTPKPGSVDVSCSSISIGC